MLQTVTHCPSYCLPRLPKRGHACSIAAVLLQIDTAIQYGEDLDVNTRDYGGDE